MGIGPEPATDVALQRTDLALHDIDLVELNEAFAAQALAVMREWKFGAADLERTNVHGSGISLGRMVLTRLTPSTNLSGYPPHRPTPRGQLN